MNQLADYNDFFLFLVGVLILGGIIFLFFPREFYGIFISDEEVSKLRISSKVPDTILSFPKISVNVILLAIIIGGFLFNQFLMWRVDSSGSLNKLFSISINITKKNNN